jgi:integrase
MPSEANRATLQEYLQTRRANRRAESTLLSDANVIRALGLQLGDKSFHDVQARDVTDFLAQGKRVRMWRNPSLDGSETITRREIPIDASTTAHRAVVVKAFFKWLRKVPGKGRYPPEVADINCTAPEQKRIPVEHLITTERATALLQSMPSSRDKAIIAVLLDSGFRAGEFCALNVGSVHFEEQWAYLSLPRTAKGLKTGDRRIMVFDCVPFLKGWWEAHPQKNNPRAPLFFNEDHRPTFKGARFKPGTLYRFVRDAAERVDAATPAGKQPVFGYPVHPHLFRHSAATDRARRKWNDAQMRDFFGWRPNSDMPSRYTHLVEKDYEEMEKRQRGFMGGDKEVRAILQGRPCMHCKQLNPLTATFCGYCLRPASLEAAAEHHRKTMEHMQIDIAKMVADELRKSSDKGSQVAA